MRLHKILEAVWDHPDITQKDQAWQSGHGITNWARARMTSGHCVYMALALNEVTGWPIYYETKTPTDHEIMHMWVVNPQQRAVDINGIHDTNHALTKATANRARGHIIKVNNPTELRDQYQIDDNNPAYTRALAMVTENPKHFGIFG